MNENVKFKIGNLLSDLNKNIGTKSILTILEEHLLSGMNENEKQQYDSFKNIFQKLKNEIKNKCESEDLIIEKIKLIAKNPQENRSLNDEEKTLVKNFHIFLERGQLIIETAINNNLKIENQPLRIYVISNFYRTVCELSLKLFTNYLIIILDYLIKQSNPESKQEIKWLNNKKMKLLNNSLGLDGFRDILSKFDKMLMEKLNLYNLIQETFLYKEMEGFSLRNNIAHEKVLFSEYDIEKIIRELKKVHRFNTAFIIVFFFEEVGDIMTSKDLIPANKFFENIK